MLIGCLAHIAKNTSEKRSGEFDVGNDDFGQFLAMAFFVAVALAALHLKDDELGATEVFFDLEADHGAGDGGRANSDLAVVAEQQNAVLQGDGLTGFGGNTVEFQGGASLDFILLATGFNYRVHDSLFSLISGHTLSPPPYHQEIQKTAWPDILNMKCTNLLSLVISSTLRRRLCGFWGRGLGMGREE